MNRSAWRSQSSVKERCASRPAQWITVREREIIRHTPSHAAPQQNTLDPQTHTSQGLVLRAFSAFRNETQSARSHMYIGIRDGYLTRRWPLCACIHLSHSSCLTSPGWGPYSLLASGQAHFTAGHDTVFQSPSMDNRSQLALQSHAFCQCLPFHSHGGYQTNMGIKAHSSCGTRDVRPRFCVRPCDVIEICISLYRSSDAASGPGPR